jgi:transcriptional regulator with XRE-family HTH domain
MTQNSSKIEFQRLFGKQVKSVRLQKKLSLRKLSQRCNIDHSDIAKYEKGEINLKLSSVYELAEGLDVHPKELFDFELGMKNSKKDM